MEPKSIKTSFNRLGNQGKMRRRKFKESRQHCTFTVEDTDSKRGEIKSGRAGRETLAQHKKSPGKQKFVARCRRPPSLVHIATTTANSLCLLRFAKFLLIGLRAIWLLCPNVVASLYSLIAVTPWRKWIRKRFSTLMWLSRVLLS